MFVLCLFYLVHVHLFVLHILHSQSFWVLLLLAIKHVMRVYQGWPKQLHRLLWLLPVLLWFKVKFVHFPGSLVSEKCFLFFFPISQVFTAQIFTNNLLFNLSFFNNNVHWWLLKRIFQNRRFRGLRRRLFILFHFGFYFYWTSSFNLIAEFWSDSRHQYALFLIAYKDHINFLSWLSSKWHI